MYEAALRARMHAQAGQNTVILHLGDHDPSGIDMTRDNERRLHMMTEYASDRGVSVEVRRLALSMAQVREHKPPPNPAKETDSRARGYVMMYGHSSWELDALEPSFLDGLVRENIEKYVDTEAWSAKTEERDDGLATLREIINEMEDSDDAES